MEYFIAIGDDRQGPFTEETIREKAKVGDVGPDNLAWNDTMDDWEPLPRVFPGMEFAPKKTGAATAGGRGQPKRHRPSLRHRRTILGWGDGQAGFPV